MQIEALDRLRNPLVGRATRTIIRDDQGNILVAVVEIGPGHNRILCHGMVDFEERLRELGIFQDLKVDFLKKPKLIQTF